MPAVAEPMHPLQCGPVRRAIEQAAPSTSAGDGRRRLHRPGRAGLPPCGIYHGEPISVFAKLDPAGPEQFTAELNGLRLLRNRAGAATPVPVAGGRRGGGRWRGPGAGGDCGGAGGRRSAEQWRRSGGRWRRCTRSTTRGSGSKRFDNFFGLLPQSNQPVGSNGWAEFYAERRLLPRLREAVDSGNLAAELAAGVERVVARLPQLCGPDPAPTLLHGDAQQNNFLTSATEAVLLDAAPYFGHPEVDLALLDYFEPVPAAVFDGYRELPRSIPASRSDASCGGCRPTSPRSPARRRSRVAGELVPPHCRRCGGRVSSRGL